MNRLEVKKFLDLLHPNGELFEVRSINGRYINSGYFTNIDTAIEEMEKYPRATFYVTLNKINSGCYGREQHDTILAINDKQKKTTGDNDIVEINNILIDFDPKRISGVSATDEEKKLAEVKMRKAYRYLRNNGFEDMIVVDSGNGYHLLVRVSIAPKDNDAVKDFLLSLSAMFSDDKVDIDTANFNPSRITKVAGVMTSKGANTPDRPHRESKIVYIPPEIKKTDFPYIEKIASFVQQEVESPSYRNNYQQFNIRDFIQKHGIPIQNEQNAGGITKFILKECPFDNSHKAPDSAIFQMSSGAIGFKCFHNSCSGKTWRDFRLKFEPSAYESKNYTHINTKVVPNHSNSNYNPIVDVTESQSTEPDFWTPSLIRAKKYAPVEYLKTCIEPIDNEIRGLEKGSITCLSGLSECGKSTFVSELICNMVNQDYRVALFSGEMGERKVLKWLSLQAAGKEYIKSTQYKNFYEVNSGAQGKIDAWFEDRLYIYNNNWGFNFDLISKKIIKCVSEQKIDCLFLDNLMMLDMSSLDRDINQQQSKFVSWLKQFAQSAHIHILYVAHPRKPLGIIRKSDVSGSFDITNRCDYLILVHRVNADFKRDAEQFLKWKSDDSRFMCTNLAELNKVRDGISEQDRWVKLYFEKESKRLKISHYENIVYGWRNDECLFDELPM